MADAYAPAFAVSAGTLFDKLPMQDVRSYLDTMFPANELDQTTKQIRQWNPALIARVRAIGVDDRLNSVWKMCRVLQLKCGLPLTSIAQFWDQPFTMAAQALPTQPLFYVSHEPQTVSIEELAKQLWAEYTYFAYHVVMAKQTDIKQNHLSDQVGGLVGECGLAYRITHSPAARSAKTS